MITEQGKEILRESKHATIVGLVAVDKETGEEYVLQRFTVPVTVRLDDSLTLNITFKGEF